MSTGFSPAVRALICARASAGLYPCDCNWVDCERCGYVTGAPQLHHRRARGMGSTKRPETNRASNAAVLCPQCHTWVESHRLAALELGWLVRQSEDPASVPVRLWDGRWVLLDDLGGITEVDGAA